MIDSKVLNKVCERDTIRHQKVYERGTILVKNGIYKGIPKGLDLYKHLLSTPPPLPPERETTPDSKGGGANLDFPRCKVSNVCILHWAEERNVP